MSLLDIATQGIKQPEGYIGSDGLIYCPICNTPKQCKIDVLGSEKVLPVICKCEKEKANKRKIEVDAERKAEAIRERVERGIRYKKYIDSNFDKDDRPASHASAIARKYAINWIDNKKNNCGIIYSGGLGTGKTFYACCIANEVVKRSSVLITSFDEIIRRSYDFDDVELYSDLQNTSLIVFDDIGLDGFTEKAIKALRPLIDIRYCSNLPTICTSNMTLSELRQTRDLTAARIYERISEMCNEQIIMVGESRRGEIRKLKGV